MQRAEICPAANSQVRRLESQEGFTISPYATTTKKGLAVSGGNAAGGHPAVAIRLTLPGRFRFSGAGDFRNGGNGGGDFAPGREMTQAKAKRAAVVCAQAGMHPQ